LYCYFFSVSDHDFRTCLTIFAVRQETVLRGFALLLFSLYYFTGNLLYSITSFTKTLEVCGLYHSLIIDCKVCIHWQKCNTSVWWHGFLSSCMCYGLNHI